jgi:hypothetical protein
MSVARQTKGIDPDDPIWQLEPRGRALGIEGKTASGLPWRAVLLGDAHGWSRIAHVEVGGGPSYAKLDDPNPARSDMQYAAPQSVNAADVSEAYREAERALIDVEATRGFVGIVLEHRNGRSPDLQWLRQRLRTHQGTATALRKLDSSTLAIAEVWLQLLDLGYVNPTAATADVVGLSLRTVNRRLSEARREGLIPEDVKALTTPAAATSTNRKGKAR